MIKVVSFDLWNTLLTGQNSEASENKRSRRMAEELKKEGFDFTVEEINEAVKKTWGFFNEEWLNKYYTLQTSASVDVILQSLGIKVSNNLKSRLTEIMQKNLLSSDNRAIEGMKELVFALKDDYSLAVISDAGFTPGRYLREVIKQVGLGEAFSVYAFSDEVGVSKPHRKIFEYVLHSLDAKPEEGVHIGDIPVTDVKGANEMGMRSVHFHREAYLFKDADANKASFSTDSPAEILNYIKGL